jgi:non-specific serine/threonine protein kinase
VRLAAAATALRERSGTPLPPAARARLDASLEVARQALGERAADEAWAGGRALSPDEAVAAARRTAEPAPAILTRREQQVAALIAHGRTNRQIATELFITEGTAANHVVHILNKLGCNSRARVAAWATEHGLLAAGAE